MVKILLFTDIHGGIDICGKGGKALNTYGSKYEEILDGILGFLTEHQIKYVINLGDFGVGSLDKSENEKILKTINTTLSSYNLLHTMGNHCLSTCNQDSRQVHEMLNISGIQEIFIEGTLHVILDIKMTYGRGEVSNKTLKRLKITAENQTEDWFLYSHYPINENRESVSYYHKKNPQNSFLVNSSNIKEIIKHSKCKRVLSGHTHMYFETLIDGITHTVLPCISENEGNKPDGRVGVFDTQDNKLEIISII